MNKHTCSICKRIFTREWNLKRHLRDVHRIAKYSKKDQVNQEIEANGYYPPLNSSFYKENDKDFYNNYTQNPHDYYNFSNDY